MLAYGAEKAAAYRLSLKTDDILAIMTEQKFRVDAACRHDSAPDHKNYLANAAISSCVIFCVV